MRGQVHGEVGHNGHKTKVHGAPQVVTTGGRTNRVPVRTRVVFPGDRNNKSIKPPAQAAKGGSGETTTRQDTLPVAATKSSYTTMVEAVAALWVPKAADAAGWRRFAQSVLGLPIVDSGFVATLRLLVDRLRAKGWMVDPMAILAYPSGEPLSAELMVKILAAATGMAALSDDPIGLKAEASRLSRAVRALKTPEPGKPGQWSRFIECVCALPLNPGGFVGVLNLILDKLQSGKWTIDLESLHDYLADKGDRSGELLVLLLEVATEEQRAVRPTRERTLKRGTGPKHFRRALSDDEVDACSTTVHTNRKENPVKRKARNRVPLPDVSSHRRVAARTKATTASVLAQLDEDGGDRTTASINQVSA